MEPVAPQQQRLVARDVMLVVRKSCLHFFKGCGTSPLLCVAPASTRNRLAITPLFLSTLVPLRVGWMRCQARLGVTECASHDLLSSYPVMFAGRGAIVAHFRCTVLLLPSGTSKVRHSSCRGSQRAGPVLRSGVPSVS